MRTHDTATFVCGALALLCLSGCPDPSPPSAEGDCTTCHAGIEHAHGPIAENDCVTCHGGDADAGTKEAAHVAVPDDWAEIRGEGLPPAPEGFIKDFAPEQLDALDPAYVRFLNPGDVRVIDQTCGTCHPDEAENMLTSVMMTNAGHYFPTLHLAGLQDDKLAHYGSLAASDPDCDEDIPGTVCDLEPLIPPGEEAIGDIIADGDLGDVERLAYEHYLAKNCNTCHQAGYPRNNSPGLYRSTGCTSCHMLYDEQGAYTGDDPTIARGSPVHAAKHEITGAVTTQQCASCHFQGGRIGLLFQGIREGGFSDDQTPENATAIAKTLYGHSPGFYFTDENDQNGIDETPPDLHYSAGMHCADCHVGSDVHGDGHLHSSSKGQVDLRCEDCHGSVRDRIVPDAEGVFRTQSGRALPQLSQGEGDTVVLTGVVDGATHEVAQVADLLADGGGASAAMHQAMGEDDLGWSHTDALTCDTCHTSYNQYCIGCHVTVDLRLDQVDYQTGQRSPGLTKGSRSTYSLTSLLLGTAPDGRVQTVHPSQQVQMAVVDAERFGGVDGDLLIGWRDDEGDVVGEFRHRDGLEANNGFVPFFQHTTTKNPRTCTTCHRADDSGDELERIRGVYGFGTGEFMLEGPEGQIVDGLQFLDDNGDPLTTWVHPGTGPVEAERLARALAVILGP